MIDVNSSKKQCATCGKLYKICFTCESEKAKGHVFWRATACSPECYQVHLVLSDYYNSFMSKSDAKEHLERLLEDRMLPYTDTSRNIIEEILKEDEPVIEESIEGEIPVISEIPSFEILNSFNDEDEQDVIVDTYESLYED